MLINGYGVNDVTIYQVELTDSPFFHILIQNGTGLTVWGIEINTPAVGTRNTDGIGPKNEVDVVIAHDMVQDGDDCVAFTSGPGMYIPVFQDIVVDGLQATNSPSGTSSLFEGYSASEPLQIELAHVSLDNTAQSAQNAYVQASIDGSNIIPAGTDVTVTSAGEIPGHVPHRVIPPFAAPPPSGPPVPPAA